MATPSTKAPALAQALENIFGRTTAIESDTCTMCSRSATTFRDELSKREYSISGMCQRCQDAVFGGGE